MKKHATIFIAINRLFSRQIGSYLTVLCISICIAFLATACTQSKQQSNPKEQRSGQNTHIVVARSETPTIKLYYNATITPISSVPVFAPIDAHVAKIYFNYGEPIKKGQVLFALSSDQLIDDYRKTVANYLQNKEDYQNTLVSFEGEKVLYKAEVISKEDYENQRASLRAKALSYNQSAYELEKLLKKANISAADIEKLNLEDMSTVNQILNKQFGQINITAPVNGVALFPIDQAPRTGGLGSGGDSIIHEGDEVKSEQLLLSIGNLEGFSIKFDVSEININQIRVGLPATVTGDAFPGITLKGQVSAVTSQAKPNAGGSGGASSGSLGMFSVEVTIPKITVKQRDIIHIGMTAKVELDIPDKPQIMLPINAIFTKGGQTMVTKLDANNRQQDVPVTAGATTLSDVSIVSGVEAGDRILLHTSNPATIRTQQPS